MRSSHRLIQCFIEMNQVHGGLLFVGWPRFVFVTAEAPSKRYHPVYCQSFFFAEFRAAQKGKVCWRGKTLSSDCSFDVVLYIHWQAAQILLTTIKQHKAGGANALKSKRFTTIPKERLKEQKFHYIPKRWKNTLRKILPKGTFHLVFVYIQHALRSAAHDWIVQSFFFKSRQTLTMDWKWDSFHNSFWTCKYQQHLTSTKALAFRVGLVQITQMTSINRRAEFWKNYQIDLF